jgi:hypothetical protein
LCRYTEGYINTSAPSSEEDNFDNGVPAQFDFMSRLVRANALPPFVCWLLLTIYLLVTRCFGRAWQIMLATSWSAV